MKPLDLNEDIDFIKSTISDFIKDDEDLIMIFHDFAKALSDEDIDRVKLFNTMQKLCYKIKNQKRKKYVKNRRS